MDFFTGILPFAKVLGVFSLMLLGIRFKMGLAPPILCGAVIMGLVFGLSTSAVVVAGGLALVQEKFLFLAAIVGLILILSDAQEKSGQSERLMGALSGYLRRPRFRLIFFPALIGLLPMPGGAVFSAPMVKAVSREMDVSDRDRVVINYWFRHVWEMAWPLYPGIILTAALADIPVTSLIARSWPGVVAMFVIGWFFFLRSLPVDRVVSPIPAGQATAGAGSVIREGLPLLVAIVGAICLETLLSRRWPHIPFEWGVILALACAIACIMMQNRLGGRFLATVLQRKSLWNMLLVVAAIFMFKDIMQAADIVQAMAAGGGGAAALFAAAVFLPFLVGLVAGINVAFVGAIFPLLIALLNSLGMEEQLIAYLILASFAGFTGVLMSPIHICFVLTCDYFKTDLTAAWRRLVCPSICFGLAGFLLFLLLL